MGLCLHRKTDEGITLSNGVHILVISGECRLNIEAPRGVAIMRDELLPPIHQRIAETIVEPEGDDA